LYHLFLISLIGLDLYLPLTCTHSLSGLVVVEMFHGLTFFAENVNSLNFKNLTLCFGIPVGYFK